MEPEQEAQPRGKTKRVMFWHFCDFGIFQDGAFLYEFLPEEFGKKYGGEQVRKIYFQRKHNNREDIIVTFTDYMDTDIINKIGEIQYDDILLNVVQGCMVCAGTKNILSKQYFFYASN